MKLFLTSDNFGDFAGELRQLVGDNRKTLLITNARDYLPDAERRAKVAEKLAFLETEGFQAQEIDLRPYFAKDPAELITLVAEYDPGLIFCTGGDMFMLATALAVSGMDDIIRQRLDEDITVYAGTSAGACVAAHDIEIYERDELRIEEIPDYYGTEAVTSGLGLIQEYVIPHADLPDFHKQAHFYRQQLQKIHADIIELNNSDAYVVNGHDSKLLRGHKISEASAK